MPAGLAAVYQKMVAKRPADRFQSMSESAPRWKPAASGQGSVAGPSRRSAAQGNRAAEACGGDAHAQAASVVGPRRRLRGSIRGWHRRGRVDRALGLGGYGLYGVIFKYERRPEQSSSKSTSPARMLRWTESKSSPCDRPVAAKR